MFFKEQKPPNLVGFIEIPTAPNAVGGGRHTQHDGLFMISFLWIRLIEPRRSNARPHPWTMFQQVAHKGVFTQC
jgi:hypothetical protein